jgi:hypothetical protein
MHDFALNDPLIDLLHVLNNQEITTQELNESLVIIKAQKDKFQRSRKVEQAFLLLVQMTMVLCLRGLTEPYLVQRCLLKINWFFKEVIGKANNSRKL